MMIGNFIFRLFQYFEQFRIHNFEHNMTVNEDLMSANFGYYRSRDRDLGN